MFACGGFRRLTRGNKHYTIRKAVTPFALQRFDGRNFWKKAADAFKDKINSSAESVLQTSLESAESIGKEVNRKVKIAVNQTDDTCKQLENSLNNLSDVLKSVQEEAEKLDVRSLESLNPIKLASSLPAMAWRVIRFQPTPEDIRSHLVLPLMSLLRSLRETKSNRADQIIVMVDLVLYSLEAALKVDKLLVSTMVGDTPVTHMKAFFKSCFLKSFVSALTRSNLTFSERLDILYSVEQECNTALIELAEKMGWRDLETEISNWKPSKPSGTTAE